MATTKTRKVNFERKSTETQIKGTLNVDGKGAAKIKTPIGLLSHMLELFTFHGFFDLTLDVKGDTHVDIHHTNEDIGIALGKAFKQALGENNKNIRRFGSGFAPMESTLGHTVVDICGRPHYLIRIDKGVQIKDQDGYSMTYLEHFIESFAKGLGATINIKVSDPSEDLHTTLETVFKSLGLAMEQAVKIDPRRKGVPSTKGIID